MTTYLWQIVNMERLTADGFVFTVHWRCDAQDGTYQASTYSTVSYQQQPGEAFIPYDQLTQDIVIGWVQNSLGKDTVEASLQSQIDAQKNPVQESGLPWAA